MYIRFKLNSPPSQLIFICFLSSNLFSIVHILLHILAGRDISKIKM